MGTSGTAHGIHRLVPDRRRICSLIVLPPSHLIFENVVIVKELTKKFEAILSSYQGNSLYFCQ